MSAASERAGDAGRNAPTGGRTDDEAIDARAKAAHEERRRRIEAEPLPANLGAMLEEFCRDDPNAVAWTFIDSKETLRRGEIFERVTRLASSLARLGVGKGTHVGVVLPNIPAFPLTWLALAWLGAVMVPVNVRYTPSELDYVLTDSEATFVVIDATLVGQLIALPKLPPGLAKERIIVHGGDGDIAGHASWEQLLADGEPGFRPAWSVGHDDLMNIQYTSGTTGFPKGCMQKQIYWLIMGRVASRRDGLTLENILIAQPFFYMDPQWLTLLAMDQRGQTFVAAQPSIARFMDWVHAHQIHFCIFPELVYRQPPRPDDGASALRRVATYGHRRTIHADLQRRFNVVAREGFGMTEVGSAMSMPIEATHMVGSGSCGLPSAYRECRVVDENGTDVAPGETGELVVRGPGVIAGYYNKPEANRASFFGDWFRTGDLFVRDSRGYFTIVGRLKDMIRRSGENIAAREVEAALVSIVGIEEAAVIGVPSAERGEEVKAYVILKAGVTREALPPESILDQAAAMLAPFKVPRYLEYVTELPRTPSQKLKKDVLKTSRADLTAGSFDRVDKVWR
ncbi:MAG: AMP-binding protein [Hyphomicrobiaceae bacterium]